MNVLGNETHSRHVGRFALLLVLSLFATMVASVALVAAAPVTAAAVPGAAPANPTIPCTWNWHRWSRPEAFTFPYADNSFDPTQKVFSQATTALGVNGWYEAASPAQFSYSGIREGVGPAEETTGANASEWTYGVGLYVMAPGTTQTISISDSGRQESHAFAFYNSLGDQFARYPNMASVSGGAHYIASEEEAKTNPSAAGGVAKPNAWSGSVSITVPSDGIVYIHYLNFDERIRAQFPTFGGACSPVVVDDTSTDNVPGTAATVAVTANDSNIVNKSIAFVDPGASGRSLVVPGEGTWQLAPRKGEISFTPEPSFVQSPTPIRYRASDGKGKVSGAATVTVEYQSVSSEADASNGNPTGETVTIAVTANDSNVDPSTVSIVDAPTGQVVDPGRGTWKLNSATGVITFVPTPGYDGDPRPISYTVNDVGGNLLPAVPVSVSFAPLVEPDESLRNLPGDIITIDVLSNDSSSDIDPSTVAIVGADSSGNLVVDGEGMWSVDDRTHEVRFIPELSFASDPTVVKYTVADITGNVSTPVEVVVDYVPATRDDESTGHPAGSIITIDVLENDPSRDLDPTTVALVDPRYDPTTRTLVIPNEGTWTVDPVTGALTVTPEDGYVGEPAPVSYVVTDDEGSVADPAVLTIGHLPLPIARADESVNNRLGETVTIDVLANDDTANVDRTTVRIVGADEASNELRVPREGTWIVETETGMISFNPRSRFDKNPTPISYVVFDVLGVSTAPTEVTVTYRGVVPEALAFVEPSQINWAATIGWALLSMVLFAATLAMAAMGRLRPAHS